MGAARYGKYIHAPTRVYITKEKTYFGEADFYRRYRRFLLKGVVFGREERLGAARFRWQGTLWIYCVSKYVPEKFQLEVKLRKLS